MKNKLREGTLVAMGGGERLHQFNFNKNRPKTTDGIPQWVRKAFREAAYYDVDSSTETTTVLYHTSIKRISNIENSPLFFTDNIELAKAWYENAIYEHGKAYAYSFEFNGKILSREQLKAFCQKNKIDYSELIADLVGNPEPEEIINIDGIKEISNICDGFRFMDYDPRDFQEDAESILILNTKALNTKAFMAFREAEYYDVDSSIEKRAGISDKQYYKWKNSDAVKRALKRFIVAPVSVHSKSFASVKNIKKDELEAALKRFNNAYSENFKILKYTFELSKIGY